jgi:hypothetical protein
MLTNRPVQLILLAAFLAFVLSVTLWFSGERDEGLFVGLWVPSILAFGAFLLSARERRHG